MQFTGEQFIPGISKKRLIDEHESRYQWVAQFTQDKIVLDIACGTGYGSNIIAANAKKVFGVDISNESIAYAKEHYKKDNVHFVLGSATDSEIFTKAQFDIICSFETIEHLTKEERVKYLINLKSWLKPNGLLVLSTPNKIITSPFTEKPLNPYHVIEFEQESLLNELFPYFSIEDIFGQRIIKKIYTYYFVWKMVHAIQKIFNYNFHIYDLANGPQITTYTKKQVPRIFILRCIPK